MVKIIKTIAIKSTRVLGDVRAERALPMQHNREHRAKRALLMQSLHERPLVQPYGLQVVWYDGDE
jgi:hypothetical protein